LREEPAASEGLVPSPADRVAFEADRGVLAVGLQDPRAGDAVQHLRVFEVEPPAGSDRQSFGGEERPRGELVGGDPEDRGRRAGVGELQQVERRGVGGLDVRPPRRGFDEVEDDGSRGRPEVEPRLPVRDGDRFERDSERAQARRDQLDLGEDVRRRGIVLCADLVVGDDDAPDRA
jgi:hypothetical protein